MAHSSVLRSCFLAVVLVSTLSLGACTTDDHSLPTVSGTNPGNMTSLEMTAKTYYDCMKDAGIDVELSQNSDGELALVHVADSHTYMQRNKDDGRMSPGENNSLTQQMMDDFFTGPNAEPALIVDGIDYSTAYVSCLDTSGYDEQAAQGSAAQMDPAVAELQVRGNNKWTACARENGWPGIQDSVMPTGTEWSEWPKVVLPSTITEDQLRQLLTACPNLDVEQAKRMNDWWQTHSIDGGYPDDYLPDPNFTFGESDDTDEPTMDHIHRLYTILQENAEELFQGTTSR